MHSIPPAGPAGPTGPAGPVGPVSPFFTSIVTVLVGGGAAVPTPSATAAKPPATAASTTAALSGKNGLMIVQIFTSPPLDVNALVKCPLKFRQPLVALLLGSPLLLAYEPSGSHDATYARKERT